MKPSIVVVGSSNTDMVIKANHLPIPGETILGGNFFMNPGGKGANQAVAAQRLGGNVTFICKTGDDIFASQSVIGFIEEGINTDFIITDNITPSGVALITVSKNGENCIVVASGANATLSPANLITCMDTLYDASIILMQLEIPLETVNFVADIAKPSGAKVILNPAPACELPLELLRNTWIITPNEQEAELLSGIAVTDKPSAQQAAKIIMDKGVEIVIITLGAKGAFVATKEINKLVKAMEVDAIDTTAAGDVFNGALAVAIIEGMLLLDAVAFACNAASISVTRMGAQSAAPHRKDVDNLLVV
jgi:ribokinase